MEKVHCDDTRKNQHSKVHFQLELIRTRWTAKQVVFKFICNAKQWKNLSSRKYTRKTNKQTCNLKFDDFLCVPVCVCIMDIPAIRIVSTHPWLQYTLRVVKKKRILLACPMVLICYTRDRKILGQNVRPYGSTFLELLWSVWLRRETFLPT